MTGFATFAGTGQLLRFVLRRDRVRLLIWVVVLSALMGISAASVVSLYGTPEALRNYATLAEGNTAIIVQAGPGHGLDDPTTGAVLMNESGIWMFISVSVMSLFMITRHTRHEEESGRAELVRAAPVGRHAPAAAAMLGALIANAAVATAVAVSIVVQGFALAGSVAFASSLVGVGMVFAAISLVSGQIASSARAATGSAVAMIGVSFVLRAVGDVGDGRLSWMSPIGWAQAIRAFADERWWVLLIPAVATVGLVIAADALTSHRDMGGGLVPQRPGRPEASPGLRGAFGLALRLQRGAIIAWVGGIAVFGVFMGVVGNEADAILTDSPEMADFFAGFGDGSLTDAFLSAVMLLLALTASGFTISAVLRLRTEEGEGRVDALLTTPLTRRTWMASHLTIAASGTVVIMAVGGLAMGLGYAIAAGEPGRVLPLVWAGLALVPAMLVLGGIAAALFGVVPRWTLGVWAAFAVALAVGLLGDVLRLPSTLQGVSPFVHAPALPGGEVDALALAALVAVTAGLATLGLTGIGRRDLG